MDGVDGSAHYSKERTEPPATLLVVVLDLNPHSWGLLAPKLSIEQCISILLVYLNAHIAVSHANQVAVISSGLHRAEMVYPREKDGILRSEDTGNASFYIPFAELKSALIKSLLSQIQITNATSADGEYSTALSGALSLALSYISKRSLLANPEEKLRPAAVDTSNALFAGNDDTGNSAVLVSRVVVINSSSISPQDYIPLMNAIFAAQSMDVPIDVLSISPKNFVDSASVSQTQLANSGSASFLQQAPDATKGLYMPLTNPEGLLQMLMMAFLPSKPSRTLLRLPTQVDVDFRAVCFCHRRVVSIGYICSICLSIFCEPPGDIVDSSSTVPAYQCMTCNTILEASNTDKQPVVVAKKKKKRKKDQSNGTNTPA